MIWFVLNFANLFQHSLYASNFVNSYVHILSVAEFCELIQGIFVVF